MDEAENQIAHVAAPSEQRVAGAKDDGGPAFPVFESNEQGHLYCTGAGATLRDYFAIHSIQPGCAELCKCAGIGFDGIRVYLSAESITGVLFDEWWRSLTLERQCDLSALVRYAEADALLRARKA